MKKAKINIWDITNYIIVKMRSLPNNNLTHMRLHKIIYYAYISYLLKNSHNKKRLIVEQPEAWKYGPIFKPLFFILTDYYEKIITKPLQGGKKSKVDAERIIVIDDIIEKTKNIKTFELVDISHHQIPQYHTFHYYWPIERKKVISDDLLLAFFSKNAFFTKVENLAEIFYATFPYSKASTKTPENQINIFDIAQFFLNKKPKMDKNKIQALLYYAQGYYLAKSKVVLFAEEMEARKLGPVIPVIETESLNQENQPFFQYLDFSRKTTNFPLTKKQTAILEQVFKKFGHQNSSELFQQIRSEFSWQLAYNSFYHVFYCLLYTVFSPNKK